MTMVSCTDMLDTNSDGLLFEKDHGMTSINDTLYSMAGILSKLQPLADRYVLQGEIRGDLLATTDKADAYLQEMNSFSYSLPDNPYRSTKDYYAVINNCNYVIHNIDTTTLVDNKQVTRKFYVAAKTVRAWTYFQMGLGFNNVKWYDKPILEVGNINDYTEMGLEDLISTLIADLNPFRNEEQANLGEIGGYRSVKSFYPIKLMLADLYLTRGSINDNKGDYEAAATLYMEQIIKEHYLTYSSYSNRWIISNNILSNLWSYAWLSSTVPSNSQVIGSIVNSTKYGFQSEIVAMNDSLEIVATPNSLKYFEDQVYCGYVYDANSTPQDIYLYKTDGESIGDLRKFSSVTGTREDREDYKIVNKYTVRTVENTNTSTNDDGEEEEEKTSYFACPTTRVSMIYLRYAEAVNRLGKPNLAFAVLKYGLTPENIADKTIVPNHEKNVTYIQDEEGNITEQFAMPSYMILPASFAENNYGMRAKGCGDVDKDTTFVIPDFTYYIDITDEETGETVKTPAPNTAAYSVYIEAAKQDTIDFVDKQLFLEHTLETAYEGNRFFDLYRYAKRYKGLTNEHRNDNFFGEIMANKDCDQVFNKDFFLDETRWFIPEEK